MTAVDTLIDKAARTMFDAEQADRIAVGTPTPALPPTDHASPEVIDPRIERVARIDADIIDGPDILNLPPVEPLIDGWLDQGMIASIVGKYGSLKTFLALNLAMSVATGEPWFGHKVHRTGRVLYIAAEGAYTLAPRIRGWSDRNGVDVPSGGALSVLPKRVQLLDPADNVALCDWVAENRPALIIGDTLSKMMSGDENSKEAMAQAYNALADVRDAGDNTTVVMLHHTGHNASGRGRGSSSFEDDIDVVLALHGQAKEGAVKLTSEKQKARENPEPFWLKLANENGNPVIERATERSTANEFDATAAVKGEILVILGRAHYRIDGIRVKDLAKHNEITGIDGSYDPKPSWWSERKANEAIEQLRGEGRVVVAELSERGAPKVARLAEQGGIDV